MESLHVYDQILGQSMDFIFPLNACDRLFSEGFPIEFFQESHQWDLRDGSQFMLLFKEWYRRQIQS